MYKNSGIEKEDALKNILGKFVCSYAERDKSVEFSDWLANKLNQDMPDMSSDSCKELTVEITDAIAEYDSVLHELDTAVDAGQSKEEWLSERMAETYADMPMADVGIKLQKVESDLNASNAQFMGETGEIPDSETIVADVDSVEWNEYSVKNKVYEIGKQAILSGLGVATNTIKHHVESGDTTDIGSMIGDALQDGLEATSCEVKATVAGAVKVAAVKGLTGMLPADTPTETICDIAGMAVENASALFDVASGKRTLTEALDKIGRAGVAAVCRFGTGMLKSKLTLIPSVGPLVANLAGGLLNHMSSPKFADNVYTAVRDVAAATWKGIKESIFGKASNKQSNSISKTAQLWSH